MNKIHRQILADYDGQKQFQDLEALSAYAPQILSHPSIQERIEATNARFEQQLLRSTKVRDEVRTGVRISKETIDVTMYEWIHLFLDRTHHYDIVEGVTVACESGVLEVDLFRKTVQFIPDSSRIDA